MPQRKVKSLLELAGPQPYDLPKYSLDYEEKGPTHGVVPGSSISPVGPSGGGGGSGLYGDVQGGVDRARGIYPEVGVGYGYQSGPNTYGGGVTYQADPGIQGGPRQLPYAPPGYGGINAFWRRQF